jgi:hypothetical protein
MTKQTLDRTGGFGSILAGAMCVWFANQHHHWESIWKVWIGMAILLAANGILMLVHAGRKGGLPAVARDLLPKPAAEPAEHKARG